MKLKLILSVILWCFESVYCSECSSYTVLNTSDRSQKVSAGTSLCDSSLSPGWYRFLGNAGCAMSTSCVPINRCGTSATGWMQGSHPTQAEGIVTRRVCYHWNSNCCNWSNNIRVRNCGGFYVYELIHPTAGCYLRYCGNGEKACNNSPCRNGGTCHDLGNSYRCECLYGFTGQQCETNVTTTVTCGEHYMQINLTKRHFPDVDWRNLHLNDKSCRATTTAKTMNLRTSLGGCGTTYREHDNKIAFWNEVSNDGRGHGPGNRSTITRGKNIAIPFYCEYGREKIVSTDFSPSKKIVYASEGSYGNFTFIMELYQSSSYSTAYPPLAYPVVVYPNQPLWVQYEVKNANADLVVFAENCRATPSNDPNATPQHVFLQRGCISDPTMVYSYDPSSPVQRFSVKSFRFVYSSSFYVYLHCELLVCHRNSTNSRCAQGCISGSRRRRETDDMDGSKEYDLSAGPFKKTNEKKTPQGGPPNWPLFFVLIAIGVVLLLVTIALSVKMLRNRRVPSQVTRPPATTTNVTVNSYEQQGVEQDEQTKSNA